ncbi:hypothetical protein ACQ4PT_054136 [Festuca glaucescens]
MMQKLGMSEEDLDDVVFEEEEKQPDEVTRCMAIAKVHTQTEFSHSWFFKNMRSAWDLAKDVKIRVIEDNLFTLHFACLGDWEKVMDGGPWVFRGKSVLIAPYDGFTKPSTIVLNTVLMWIQIHDLPDGYKGLVKTLAGKVGKYVEQEPPSTDFVGNFYRVCVKIDVTVPLKSVVSIIRGGKRELFLVKYERLPDWCSAECWGTCIRNTRMVFMHQKLKYSRILKLDIVGVWVADRRAEEEDVGLVMAVQEEEEDGTTRGHIKYMKKLRIWMLMTPMI